jgi:hypothetical protein
VPGYPIWVRSRSSASADRSAEKSGEPIDRRRILADRLLWAASGSPKGTVEGPLDDSGLIEGSRQGDPRIPVCTERIVSKAVGSTLRRGLVTHEGCEHQIHSNQVVDKIVNVPVTARGRCQPLFVANSGDQVIDGRHTPAELIPKRWRWSHQRPPLSLERERTLQDRVAMTRT